jgi:hypothetical protein
VLIFFDLFNPFLQGGFVFNSLSIFSDYGACRAANRTYEYSSLALLFLMLDLPAGNTISFKDFITHIIK